MKRIHFIVYLTIICKLFSLCFSLFEEETAEEEEEEAVAVTVRFEGPNAEKDKQMREKSYQYLQQKNASEPWINMNYHQFGVSV